MPWNASQMAAAPPGAEHAGFFSRVAKRAITALPWVSWDVGAPLQGPVNQARALSLAPVWAANRHIADTGSTLPLQAFRKLDSRREPMSSLPQLFKILDDAGELVPWLYVAFTSMTLRGNTVGLVTLRDGMGFPTGVTWLPMDEVYVDDENPRQPRWFWRGVFIPSEDIVHIPWFKVAGRTLGLAPIEAFALTVNSGLEAQEFGLKWFRSGGVPPGTFKNAAKTVPQAEADIVRSRLTAAIRSGNPLVYGADWEYSPITIPPEQAQFVEASKLAANQIAAIYGLAPEEVGGEAANSLTYANEEMRQTTRMANLRPYLVRFERKFSSLLPDRQHVAFNADAVIRADVKSRHEVYKIKREIGLNSVNELRALENLPPIPGGDTFDPLTKQTPAAPAAPPEPESVSSNGNGAPVPARS